jgi:hypothetical protein
MADGKGCKCAAHSESECGCDADWTPQEVYDLRAEIERLRLTDAEREAIERACCSLGGVIDNSAERAEWDADARMTLLSLLERTRGTA